MATGNKIYGCGGFVSGCSGLYGDFQSWSFNLDVRTVEYQSFDKQGWIEILPTGMAGTFTTTGAVLYGSGTLPPLPFGSGDVSGCEAFDALECTWYLGWRSGCYLTGSGLITGAQLTRGTTDIATFNINGNFLEQPKLYWVTT